MRSCRRRPAVRVAASLLGLAGALAGLIGTACPGAAQDLRTLQVWPDRSIGVASASLEAPTAPPAPQVFPFGVTRTSAGDVVVARTYLHFPLDVFPPGAEILHATLYVYVDSSSGTGEATVGAYRVLEPWGDADRSADPATWPALLDSPVAATGARFDVVTPSTPVPVATPAFTPTPTLTATQTTATQTTATQTTATRTATRFTRPAGHALIQGPMVTVDPPIIQVDVGATTSAHIRIENVTDLYYAGVYLTFDPALLEVVDDDPAADGVQIEPGDFLSPGVTEENIVYPADGEIDFSRVVADDPVSGSGVLATITFQGKAVGISALEFDAVFLEDYDGEPIDVDIRHGSVTVVGQGSPLPTSPASPLPTPTATVPGTPAPSATPAATSTPPPSTPPPESAPSPPPAASVVTLEQVAGTWLTWDVTALMRAWLAGEVPDDGLALAPAPAPDADPETAGDLLIARQFAADDPNTRPYLVVGFEVNPVTPAPGSVLPPAGGRRGWRGVGWLLVGAALLVLGLTMWHAGRRGRKA